MADASEKPVEQRLDDVNALLAEWAARSAETSEALKRRLQAMGYDIAGKSEAEVAEVLKRPPTGTAAP